MCIHIYIYRDCLARAAALPAAAHDGLGQILRTPVSHTP